jgi:glycine/serine hydroxymethyltransferase
VVLFDYSQLLGLIAAGLIENPLNTLPNCILYGGTHKTMPGPAHGIIMTNNEELYWRLDKEINPKFLRNTQTHQVISLCFAMIEMKYHGRAYQQNTVESSRILGECLKDLGVPVVEKNNVYSNTHQLFIETSYNEMCIMYENAIKENVTLNVKKKPLFKDGFGIRLGLQEVSRYSYSHGDLECVAHIIKEISERKYDKKRISDLFKCLPEKRIHFTFKEDDYSEILKFL